MKKLIALCALLVAGAAGAATAPAADGLAHQGKVLSVLAAGQYTYIEVAEGGKTVWLAAPATPLKKDMQIRYEDGSEMLNFRSKTLNRTFPSVFFIGRLAIADKK